MFCKNNTQMLCKGHRKNCKHRTIIIRCCAVRDKLGGDWNTCVKYMGDYPDLIYSFTELLQT